MTPEQIEKHRMRFESLEQSSGNPINYDQINEGRYFCEYQQNRWIGYLMHAENQVIELIPEYISKPGYYYKIAVTEGQLTAAGIQYKIKSSGSE